MFNDTKHLVTALSEWLKKSDVTANKLATTIGVAPSAIYALVKGDADLVGPKTLIEVSNHTDLSLDALIRPYYAAPLATNTGDHRFNHLLAKIGKHLHAENCNEKLQRFVHADSRCRGLQYQREENHWVDWSEMCSANARQKYTINSLLLSATWYIPMGETPHDSRTLHTYWRATITSHDANTTYDTTFVVLGFEKSILEMDAVELPKMVTWWWHQPSALELESSDQRISELDKREMDLAEQVTAPKYRLSA